MNSWPRAGHQDDQIGLNGLIGQTDQTDQTVPNALRPEGAATTHLTPTRRDHHTGQAVLTDRTAPRHGQKNSMVHPPHPGQARPVAGQTVC